MPKAICRQCGEPGHFAKTCKVAPAKAAPAPFDPRKLPCPPGRPYRHTEGRSFGDGAGAMGWSHEWTHETTGERIVAVSGPYPMDDERSLEGMVVARFVAGAEEVRAELPLATVTVHPRVAPPSVPV